METKRVLLPPAQFPPKHFSTTILYTHSSESQHELSQELVLDVTLPREIILADVYKRVSGAYSCQAALPPERALMRWNYTCF